jgi:hypothetical protein
MKVLVSDDEVLERSTGLSYIIGVKDVNELHGEVVDLMRAASVGRDCFFEANQKAWEAIDDGLEFFKSPRTRSEILTYMEGRN